MKSLYEIGSRIYQTTFRMAIPVMPYRQPERLYNEGELVDVLKRKGISSVLCITDEGLVKAGIVEKVIGPLRDAGIKVAVFDKTVANPTIRNCREARIMYYDSGAQAIIGLGGGSPMDCAKGTGAIIARERKDLKDMRGVLKVLMPTPLLIAVPTTAGTGSETTLAAVITDEKTHFKYAINDFCLIPSYALLDAKLTVSLPKSLTATTGMDALTHAVEAFIGRSTTRETRSQSLQAVRLIYENIKEAYDHGDNLKARENMLDAAYLAGCAFTVSYVGYVHAIAHSLGGQYGIPHGLANAVILPYVLKGYGEVIYPKLKVLAIAARVADEGDSEEVAAKKFIASIEELNASMGIPNKLKGIKDEDIPMLAKRAANEGNPLYPVPVFMTAKELERFYFEIKE